MKLSTFGQKFAAQSGISELMDDLGAALSHDPSLVFMGGGNPGRIESVQAFFAERLRTVLDDRDTCHELLGVYQAPQGDLRFRRELAAYLRKRQGWPLDERHIAVANGSQSAFFVLYNLFAGAMNDGLQRRIHLPLSPEYVGYRDIGLGEDFFSATRPRIEKRDAGFFKYHLNTQAHSVADDVAAFCISRPSNPTGNMVTDDEIHTLDQAARDADVPLIIDGAYGYPFPGLVYGAGSPFWNDNTILMMSLSKLGLPGARTGIVIARPDIAEAFARANTVVSLACGTLGPALLRGMLADNSLERLCVEQIQPYYRERRALALKTLRDGAGDLPLRVHEAEGAFFLWLWCENLPVDSRDLYRRLKSRGVIVLPGNDFFIGTGEDWHHRHECLRISYAGDADTITRGIGLILSELHDAYAS